MGTLPHAGYDMPDACAWCGGDGWMGPDIEDVCPVCNGSGNARKPKVNFMSYFIRVCLVLAVRATAVIVALDMSGCASVPQCPPQEIRTVSVCTGQQSVIRYRDFLGTTAGKKKLCPPIYVVTAQLCGR